VYPLALESLGKSEGCAYTHALEFDLGISQGSAKFPNVPASSSSNAESHKRLYLNPLLTAPAAADQLPANRKYFR